MPAQDCMGNTFDVKGYVTDSQNNPIANASIRVWDEGKYELRALTDERGYFRTESIFSFGCYAFQVEISVDGFESKILSYFPPSEGFTSELPDEITIQLEQMRK